MLIFLGFKPQGEGLGEIYGGIHILLQNIYTPTQWKPIDESLEKGYPVIIMGHDGQPVLAIAEEIITLSHEVAVYYFQIMTDYNPALAQFGMGRLLLAICHTRSTKALIAPHYGPDEHEAQLHALVAEIMRAVA